MNQKIYSHPQFSLLRDGKAIILEPIGPHLCFSSARVNGGFVEGFSHFINYQSCEGKNHHEQFEALHKAGIEGQHKDICDTLALDPQTSVSMGTAADMSYLATSYKFFEDLEVLAFTTAGVSSNAARAGDEAQYNEKPNQNLLEKSGTINTLLYISKPLTHGNLALSLVTASEAKAATLMDLEVPSKQGFRKASGTGTDTIAIICPIVANQELKYGGHHTKLGELIGKAIEESLVKALEYQNGLVQSLQRNLCNLLHGFGFTREYFSNFLKSQKTRHAELALDNLEAILFEPRSSLCALAIHQFECKRRMGLIPEQTALLALGQELGLLRTAQSSGNVAYEAVSIDQESDLNKIISEIILEGFAKKWN